MESQTLFYSLALIIVAVLAVGWVWRSLKSPRNRSDSSTTKARVSMRIVIYLLVLIALTAIAWRKPFLFELPLITAVGGAYWAFFSTGK